MKLPNDVFLCWRRLEEAGFACYAVGGCVRDALLGITPQDYDLCTAATPEEMKGVFSDFPLVCAGEKHGTVGVVLPQGVVEITTFRTEGAYQDNRHPDWVQFVTDIHCDLARRDFTVNAMAYSPTCGLVDPFGGQQDLERHILRAVGDPETRFQEDSLRILRGVRFAVRYQLTPEENTMEAMVALAPLLDNLVRERVFDELCKLLLLADAPALLRFAPILTQAIPELAPTLGFDQHSPHHAFDVYTHTAHVTAAVPKELALRWAALLHDIGKVPVFSLDENGRGHFFSHAQESAKMADAILLRFKAPTLLRKRVVFLIETHMVVLSTQRKGLRRQLSRWGEEALTQLIALQKADFYGKGVADSQADFAEIEQVLADLLAENACLQVRDLAINGNDLLEMGFTGRQIGATLNDLLQQVLDETLPNRRQHLLDACKKYLTEETT